MTYAEKLGLRTDAPLTVKDGKGTIGTPWELIRFYYLAQPAREMVEAVKYKWYVEGTDGLVPQRKGDDKKQPIWSVVFEDGARVDAVTWQDAWYFITGTRLANCLNIALAMGGQEPYIEFDVSRLGNRQANKEQCFMLAMAAEALGTPVPRQARAKAARRK